MAEARPFIQYPYMTDIPERRVQTKVHTHLGHAKNAIIGSLPLTQRATLLHWVNDDGDQPGWVTLYEVEPGTPQDQLPWVEQKLHEFRAQERVTHTRDIIVSARNQEEAYAKYAAGEWTATEWKDAESGGRLYFR